jgi:hypothetical protein
MRNYIDIVDNSRRQEAEIKEMAALFEALALRQVMLNEGRLDEAGVWNAVKSAVGAGVSGVKTANDAINRLGQLAQNTAPVQGFDTKVDGILQKIGAANPKLADTARKYGEWAKQNPVKQGLIIGMLTAVASLVTGPAGGAAAGAVLRAGNELLKGEKASTAIGKSVKGAAFGWLAGVGIRELGDFIANMHIQMNPVKGIRDVIEANLDYQRIEMGGSRSGSAAGHLRTMIPADEAQKLQGWWNTAVKAAKSSNYASAQQQFNQISAYFASPDYKKWLDGVVAVNKTLEAQKDQILSSAAQMQDIAKNLSAAVQGAVTGAAAGGEKKTKAEPAPAGAASKTTPGGAATGGAMGAVKGAIGKAGAAIKGAFGSKTPAQPVAQPGPGTVPTAEPGVAVQQPAAGGFKRNISQLQQPAQQQPATPQAAPAKPQPGQKWQPAWKNKKIQGTTTTTQTFKEAKKFSYKLSIGE